MERLWRFRIPEVVLPESSQLLQRWKQTGGTHFAGLSSAARQLCTKGQG